MKLQLHVDFSGVQEAKDFYESCCFNGFSTELRFREVVVNVRDAAELNVVLTCPWNRLFQTAELHDISPIKLDKSKEPVEATFIIDAFYSSRCKKTLDGPIDKWPTWFMYRRGETISYYKSWRHFRKTGQLGEFFETSVI